MNQLKVLISMISLKKNTLESINSMLSIDQMQKLMLFAETTDLIHLELSDNT